jgi:hypothetical protein
MSLSFRFHLVVRFSTALAGGCPSDTKKSYLATGPNFGDKLRLLQKVELLPGSFRLRRADLEAIAAGQRKLCRNENGSDFHH